MRARPDDRSRVPHQHQDLYPIMLRWKPRMPTMADWARSVDTYLKEKAALDRLRVQQVKQPHPDGRSLAKQAKQATGGQDR